MARFEPPADDEGLLSAIAVFDCVRLSRDGEDDPGEAAVRDFLRSAEFPDGALSGTSTSYLLLEPDDFPGRILGYVTLAVTQMRLTEGEKKSGERLEAAHGSHFGAVRIAMIGVDREYAGNGYGKRLMDFVIAQTAQMSREVSVRFVVADAVNTQLAWYQRQGFVENRSEAEVKRLKGALERTGIAATSVRLDLGPDPRVVLQHD